MLSWLRKWLGIDAQDFRIRRLERAKYWKEKYALKEKRTQNRVRSNSKTKNVCRNLRKGLG